MSMSQPRNKGTVKMLCPAGCLIPRPAMTTGPIVPKWQRFYNWPRDAKGQPIDDAPDFPASDDIPEVIVEVPADSYHLRTLIFKGPCRLADEVPAPTPKPKQKKDRG